MAEIKSHTRTLKSGKTITVRAHTRGGSRVSSTRVKSPNSRPMTAKENTEYYAKKYGGLFKNDHERAHAISTGFKLHGNEVYYYDKEKRKFFNHGQKGKKYV